MDKITGLFGLYEKAVGLLGLSSSPTQPPVDGEIIFSKNNICVQQNDPNGTLLPGYFTLTSSFLKPPSSKIKTTLVLTWVPNSAFKSNTISVASSLASLSSGYLTKDNDTVSASLLDAEMDTLMIDGSPSIASNNDSSMLTDAKPSKVLYNGVCDEICDITKTVDRDLSEQPLSTDITRPTTLTLNKDNNLSDTSLSSGSTEGPDSPVVIQLPADSPAKSSALPSSNMSTSTFRVDLINVRSIRLLYNHEQSSGCGQLVLASRESQYKTFHFYNGGLDKVAEILAELPLCLKQKQGKGAGFSQLFSVNPIYSDEFNLNPDECGYRPVTADVLGLYMNSQGAITDPLGLRKAIFFCGLDPSLRRQIWPFLLKYFPYDSTSEEREQIRNDKYIEYQKLRKCREQLSEDKEWKQRFWRAVENTVDKDVIRTDRSHDYYKGDDNLNVKVLKEILLTYATQNPDLGYTQGMSDLLAPILAEMKQESDAYWCFVGLMQRTIFVSSPKDHDMDRQLMFLKELLRVLQPDFHKYIQSIGDTSGLLFVHRWILLCFKREFHQSDAMSIWESCWTNLQTEFFHLFVATAIIEIYAEEVISQAMSSDDILLYFSNLSGKMDATLVLFKARSCLHQFRMLATIPCTLKGLCSLCSPGMWDSGHTPSVQCTGHRDIDDCPYLGISPTENIYEADLDQQFY